MEAAAVAANDFLFEDLTLKQVVEAFKQAIHHSFGSQQITEELYNMALAGIFFKEDCIYSGYNPKKKNGYTQVSYHGRKYDLHRLSCSLRFGKPLIDMEASHLCPNQIVNNCRGCFNPLHLCWEDGFTNKTRSCCQKYASTIGYKCPHIIPCLCCVENGNCLSNFQIEDPLILNGFQ